MSAKEPMEGMELKRAQDSLVLALRRFGEKYTGHKKSLIAPMLRDLSFVLSANELREMLLKFNNNITTGSVLDKFGKKPAADYVSKQFDTLIKIVVAHERELEERKLQEVKELKELDERLGATAQLINKIGEIDNLVDDKIYAIIGSDPKYKSNDTYRALKSVKAELAKESNKTWEQDDPGPAKDQATLNEKFHGTVEEVLERMKAEALATAPKLGRARTNPAVKRTPISTSEIASESRSNSVRLGPKATPLSKQSLLDLRKHEAGPGAKSKVSPSPLGGKTNN